MYFIVKGTINAFSYLFIYLLLYNIVVVLPYIDMNPPWVYMCSPSWTLSHVPPHPIPLGHPSAPAPSTLYHALNLDWWFIPHVIIYMFQCNFLTHNMGGNIVLMKPAWKNLLDNEIWLNKRYIEIKNSGMVCPSKKELIMIFTMNM